jgi:phage replication O-like protein O
MFDNAVIDHLMPQLSPTEWKVLTLIVRKTVGWNKEEDSISYSQIKDGTGIKSDATISKAIKALVGLDVVRTRVNGDRWKANSYRLNRSFVLPSTTENEVEPTSKNEVEPTSKNEVTKDIHINTKEPAADGSAPSEKVQSDHNRIKEELFDFFVEKAGLTEFELPEEGGRNKLFYQPLLTLYLYYRPANTTDDGGPSKTKYNYDAVAIAQCKDILAKAVRYHEANELTIKSVKSVTSAMGDILRGRTDDALLEEIESAIRYYASNYPVAMAQLSDRAKLIVKSMGKWRDICSMKEKELKSEFHRVLRLTHGQTES